MHETTKKLEWKQCQYLLDPDGGAFRELHIPDLSVDECAAIFEHLRSSYPDLHFATHPEDVVPSAEEHSAIASEEDQVLFFAHEGLGLWCYFDKTEKIEFSFDVRDITVQRDLNILSGIIEGFAEQVGRDVLITPENASEYVEGRFIFDSRQYEILQGD